MKVWAWRSINLEISVFETKTLWWSLKRLGGVEEYEYKDTYCADAYGHTRIRSQDTENVPDSREKEQDFDPGFALGLTR